MSKTIVAVSGLDGLVSIPLAHGAVLILTQAEFARGITRGKAQHRALQQAAREEARPVQREAQRLAWLDDAPDRH